MAWYLFLISSFRKNSRLKKIHHNQEAWRGRLKSQVKTIIRPPKAPDHLNQWAMDANQRRDINHYRKEQTATRRNTLEN
jgi:hypothetical protein